MHDNFAVGEHIGFGKVILQEEDDFEWSGLSHWQFDCSLHGVEFHLADVPGCLIDHD